MAAENLNKSKLKTNTSTRKSILNLVTLPSFSISGEISAEKIVNFTDVCMTGGIMHIFFLEYYISCSQSVENFKFSSRPEFPIFWGSCVC